MSVNARLALAMLALGHDLRRATPNQETTRLAPAARKTDAVSTIARLADSWLKGTKKARKG